MKKFSLKPLGDSGMKVLCKSCFFIGLLMTFSLTACSDDDDDTVAPVFPEKQNIVCNAGEKKETTFPSIFHYQSLTKKCYSFMYFSALFEHNKDR